MKNYDGNKKSTYLNWSDEKWCEPNVEELMSVKPLHSDEAYKYICQSNPVLQVYSFHFISTNEGIETVVKDKHEFQGRNW